MQSTHKIPTELLGGDFVVEFAVTFAKYPQGASPMRPQRTRWDPRAHMMGRAIVYPTFPRAKPGGPTEITSWKCLTCALERTRRVLFERTRRFRSQSTRGSAQPEALGYFGIPFSKSPGMYTRQDPGRSAWVLSRRTRLFIHRVFRATPFHNSLM